VRFGDPIVVPPDASRDDCERLRLAVQEAMIATELQARRAL
jgi:hypothetical protein